MTQYARGTTVSVKKSRDEIEDLLVKYGASGFQYTWQDEAVAVAFKIRDRSYRMVLPNPDPTNPSVEQKLKERQRRTRQGAATVRDQFIAERWRALVLFIKAVLVAAETEIIVIEDVLLAYTIMADGSTLRERIQPQLQQMYQTGRMPPLLAPPSD